MIIILTTVSCETDRQYFLKGCCDNEPVQDYVGNARVYIPNIFTPNEDGINDLFFVHGDSIHLVEKFEIRDRKDHLIFSESNFLPDDYTKAWDGKIDDEVQKGLYDVTATIVAKDGTVRIFESKVCNYPCGLLNDNEMVSIEGCHFSNEWKCGEWDDGCIHFEGPGCFE